MCQEHAFEIMTCVTLIVKQVIAGPKTTSARREETALHEFS